MFYENGEIKRKGKQQHNCYHKQARCGPNEGKRKKKKKEKTTKTENDSGPEKNPIKKHDMKQKQTGHVRLGPIRP